MDEYKCTKVNHANCVGRNKEDGNCHSIENCMFKEQIITNKENIQNMSAEELAKFLRKVEQNAIEVSFDKNRSICNDWNKFAIPNIIDWLNQPVKK